LLPQARGEVSPATAIEYLLIAACISVAIIAVVSGIGTKLEKTPSDVKPISQDVNKR